MCLLLFYYETQVNEVKVLKKVETFKKVTRRVENLKVEVLLFLFTKHFLE